MPTQLTLVSFYGDKPRDFAGLIARCQQLVAKTVGSAFIPYDVRQVHATIIGLERHHAPAYNANFFKHRGRNVPMDFSGFLTRLRESGRIPFEVQLGGFANRDYPFTSRDKTPFERSFSVQEDEVVVMGWPVQVTPPDTPAATPATRTKVTRSYPPTLDGLRRAAQNYGILHRYHRAETDADNDLFFRIGLIDAKAVAPEAIDALEKQARKYLSTQRPLVIRVGLEDIYIAAYDDDRLPVSSTRTWPLADPQVTGSFVAGLFK